jgi:hypothetical protein
MKTDNKKDSLKTVDLNKLNAVTGGAWAGQWGSGSWNNWSNNWSSQSWAK